MWISKEHYTTLNNLINSAQERNTEMLRREGAIAERCRTLEAMKTQLESQMNWFKHRLNQVERERGQLIQAAIGVKIAVPEFVPTYEKPDEALNEMPDLSTVGMDAKDDEIGLGEMTPDYSMMPGYKGN